MEAIKADRAPASAARRSRSPEVELLLDACAPPVHAGGNAKGGVAAVHAVADWNRLVGLAGRHKLVPALYRTLRAHHAPDGMPPALMDRLRAQVEGNARRNLVLAGELLRLVELFERHRLNVLPYKGPVWAVALQGDLSRRQFWDLDLLIDRRDLGAVRRLMRANGFDEPAVQLAPTVHGERELVSRDGTVKIDLHWRFLYTRLRSPVAFRDLWRRREAVTLLNRPVPHFQDEDLMVVLALYATKEPTGTSLAYVADIATLVGRQPDLDWDEVLRRAQALGALRALLLGLTLARNLMGSELMPEELRRRADDDAAVASLAAEVERRMFGRPAAAANEEGGGPSTFLPALRWQVRTRERLRDRLIPYLYLPLAAILPSRSDREALPLPDSLVFLYYVLRPIRLVGKYVRRLTAYRS